MTTIGFIGLGIMGAPMAEHLADGGHKVITHTHRAAVPAALESKGVEDLGSHKAVAKASDVVIMIVPDTPQVEQVLFAENGVAAGLSKGKLVIDMSSISPIDTKAFAQKIAKLGADYVDAPVSGGEVGAKAASLTIMVGATDGGFARAKPLLDLMGKNITHVGPIGAGQTTKVANQIIVALNIEAVAEALLFASKAGADPAKVREALMGGFASSKVLEIHAERMINRSFDPGFRIRLHQKDLNLALQNAKEMGISLPNTATAQELFNSCSAHGGDDDDHSGLVQALERMANHKVCP